MDTSKLKNFAQSARRQLKDKVSDKLKVVLAENNSARREKPKAVEKLEQQIRDYGEEQVIEQVAYTWFNRFCALRFMDLNNYNRIRVVSPAEGQFQPEILAEAKMGQIDDSIASEQGKKEIFALLDGSTPSSAPQAEAYRLLVVGFCNYYHQLMPYLFERINDYTELLMPDDLISERSILAQTREAMTPDACQDVEVIGWLYQFYISEKKDDVFAQLKKGRKIPPEDIPSATQLFTPHWIVCYLVENSLGRLWMLNHPQSKLVEQMDYYIEPEQTETDFLQVNSPEELKICDPACGSGHLLVYAFDLLYRIYEEQGYSPAEIPKNILTHNLYGIEIDERAGELASFALTMKAREKHRRFLRKPVQPNICVLENIHFTDGELKDYMDFVGRDLFTVPLQETLHQFWEAKNFGSLIRPQVTDVGYLLQLLDKKDVGGQLFLYQTHQKVRKVLEQANYLSENYHVVIANPPYMKNLQMNSTLKTFVDKEYSDGRANLCCAFLKRVLGFSIPKGFIGMILLHGWMFTSRYQELRIKLLSDHSFKTVAHFGTRAFDSIGGEVVQTVAFTACSKVTTKDACVFIDCRSGNNEAEKERLLRGKYHKFVKSTGIFQHIPGSPMAYWETERAIKCFKHSLLEDYADLREGLATGDNTTFVRFWFEVSLNRIYFNAKSSTEFWEQKNATWVPLKSGGPYRKWYGNNEKILRFDKQAYNQLKQQGNRCASESKYFLESLTWSDIGGTKSFGVRLCDQGFVFTTVGHSLFAENLYHICGFLCSSVASQLAGLLNPTLHANPGDIKRLPYSPTHAKQTRENVIELVRIAREDWDESELSWNFERSPLSNKCNSRLETNYQALKAKWQERISIVKRLEEENNKAFSTAYKLIDVVDSDVPLSEITLTCNPYYRYDEDKPEEELENQLLADTMKEFISYAVGCMFGRYSLDKPGLILANQGETSQDYYQQVPNPTFPPDEDNVIPILDDDWFTDDITERFRQFLRVTFGDEYYEENLKFIENAIGKNIRNYFLRDFYKEHVRRYKKRPIYWLFSSPKGTFNALIYMHRYRPDTVSIILNNYLREFQTKLNARKNYLESISISESASASEKTKASKQIDKLNKKIKELEDYDRDVLYPLATKQIEIDLDDGVKVNYPKFGKALKNIKL